MIIKKSLMLLMMAMLAISGCGNVAPSLPTITTLSYSITPDKDTYTAGEEIVITATAVGPNADDVIVAWGYRLSGGSANSFPQSTDLTYTLDAPNSGTLVITGEPGRQLTVDGVEQYEGSVTYNIRVE